ncbi:MAG: 2OG-Fe(II) oxygenase [Sphingomonas sp.]|uniref:TIGR02466 family protein n=1 Tax=Sphingomonas sp. TaxID=28214 RepID=UPI001B0D599C|nr:TIGR02466 family protein [Sphingomonas sp.]MBO9622196.1 2OG-Fe(II) oxygenase [Sphingomonas sp.]
MTSSQPDTMLRVRAERVGLFETPILHGRVADHESIDAELAQAIRARMAEGGSIGRSNIGGWHSPTDLLGWGGAAAERVTDAAIRLARRMSHFDDRDAASVHWSARVWANVLAPGGLNMSHAHPGVLWAAVYYVDAGLAPGETEGGELFLEDPRFPVPLMTFPGFRMIGADGLPQLGEYKIKVQAGDLVLFPGFMRHGVTPHRGSRDRISVAMNLYAKEG